MLVLVIYFFPFYLLIARNEERGQQAIKKLQKEGLEPKFHLLDISSINSIKTFASYLKSSYGGIDILVNNAAMAYKVIFCACLVVDCGTQIEGKCTIAIHVNYCLKYYFTSVFFFFFICR